MVVLDTVRSPLRRKGFTLIELLVVISIIILIAGIAVPISLRSLSNIGLTQSGDELVSVIGGGREVATSQGKPVEVRFYYTDGTGESLASVELFLISDDGDYDAEAVSWKPGQGIDLHPTASHTNLPESSSSISQDSDGRSYRSFLFRADGSAELDPNITRYVTLKQSTEDANFYSVTLDPATGVVRSYRP